MDQINQIVWHEGMTLDPHHFQQWDLYHQAVLQFQISKLSPHYWGFSELTIDKDRLSNGQFALVRCEGIMPDGTVFRMPDQDRLPPYVDIVKTIPPHKEQINVYLGLPMLKFNGGNCNFESSENRGNERFSLIQKELNDLNTGKNPRQVSIARTNFHVLVSEMPPDDFNVLPIAEIIRQSGGKFEINPEFIPSCISIGGPESLKRILQSVLELMVGKARSLRDAQTQLLVGQKQFDTTDAIVLHTLSILNENISILNHLHTLGTCHPETLFLFFLKLAGQLLTLSPQVQIGDLPQYDHNHLTHRFLQLTKILKELLGEEISARFVKIPLEKQNESLYLGKIQDTALCETGQFYLACQGPVSDEIRIKDFTSKIRIASPDIIEKVLTTYTNALNISSQPKQPPGLPVVPGVQYLKLEQKGPFWTGIVKNQKISIYIPKQFEKVSIELIVIK